MEFPGQISAEINKQDAAALCGARHGREAGKVGHRWGRTRGPIGFHGGKVVVERPRVRAKGSKAELALPSWSAAIAEDWLGAWALNLMLINVSTRRFGRAVRLPEGDIPAGAGAGVSKSAVSRRFVALSAERMADWMATDLSALDLLVIQIDGLHLADDLTLVAAVGIDGEGVKHPLGVIEGATENAAVVQALLDNLIGRGLDAGTPRLFIIDGAKALTKAIRRTFGRDTPIQRCQVHKSRNIIDRLPKSLHASVRKTLRQAGELDDAETAEKLLRNLARLRLPPELRRSLACTNIIENMMGSIRRTCRNVKRWRNAAMALRWTAAGMIEAAKGFRKLKAHKHLPALRAALAAHKLSLLPNADLAQPAKVA